MYIQGVNTSIRGQYKYKGSIHVHWARPPSERQVSLSHLTSHSGGCLPAAPNTLTHHTRGCLGDYHWGQVRCLGKASVPGLRQTELTLSRAHLTCQGCTSVMAQRPPQLLTLGEQPRTNHVSQHRGHLSFSHWVNSRGPITSASTEVTSASHTG